MLNLVLHMSLLQTEILQKQQVLLHNIFYPMRNIKLFRQNRQTYANKNMVHFTMDTLAFIKRKYCS